MLCAHAETPADVLTWRHIWPPSRRLSPYAPLSTLQALWRDTAASLPSDESELRAALSLKPEESRRKALKKPASKQKRKNYAAAKTTTNAHLNR